MICSEQRWSFDYGYYLTDHLGSTRAVVDDAGTVLETFDYYPFGLLMPKRNTAGANTIEKFTGKERDEEGGLNLDYFGARYYDPAISRWLSVDPLAKRYPEWSPYSYTLGNPINVIDPDGRMNCPPDCVPAYLGDWKTSIEAAFGPITSAIANFLTPEIKASGSVEVGIEGSGSVGVEASFSGTPTFDSNGLPTGEMITESSFGLINGEGMTSVSVDPNNKEATTTIDGKVASFGVTTSADGTTQMNLSGGRGLEVGVLADSKGNVGATAGTSKEIGLGNFFVKPKGQVEVKNNPGSILERVSQFITNLEDKLRISN